MILEELKSKTAEVHQKVEATPLMLPFTNRTVTKDEYIYILAVFYGFFHPLESLIDKVCGLQDMLPDYSSRRKSSSILNDLNQLNVSETPLESTVLPVIETIPQALGALYVLEGSTLGGRFITGVLNDKLQLDPSNGASFFHGYGPETGKKWTFFKSTLEHYEADKAFKNDVITSAIQTFDLFYQWINCAKQHRH